MLLQERGLFLGNRLNRSEDSNDWVETLWESAVRKITHGAPLCRPWHEEVSGCAESILTEDKRQEGQLCELAFMGGAQHGL